MTALQPSGRGGQEVVGDFETLKEVVSGVRTIRFRRTFPTRRSGAARDRGHNDRFNSVIADVPTSNIASVRRNSRERGFFAGTSTAYRWKTRWTRRRSWRNCAQTGCRGFLKSVLKAEQRAVRANKARDRGERTQKQADARANPAERA